MKSITKWNRPRPRLPRGSALVLLASSIAVLFYYNGCFRPTHSLYKSSSAITAATTFIPFPDDASVREVDTLGDGTKEGPSPVGAAAVPHHVHLNKKQVESGDTSSREDNTPSELASGSGGNNEEDDDAKEEEQLGLMSRGRARKLNKQPGATDEGSKRGTERGSPIGGQDGEEEKGCLSMIFYDKPMKTGSSAVTSALEELLKLHGEKSLICSLRSCGAYAEKLCAGTEKRVHLIDHIAANVSTALCLKRMGYYSVTSIREPTARWNSAFLFNKWKKQTHYGIHYNSSYDEFMMQIPNCALLKYYDRGPANCKGDVKGAEFQRRMKAILERFDEVIDLYGEPETDLHKRLIPFLGLENVTKKQPNTTLGTIPKEYLQYEQELYEALRRKRTELINRPKTGRLLCRKPRIPTIV